MAAPDPERPRAANADLAVDGVEGAAFAAGTTAELFVLPGDRVLKLYRAHIPQRTVDTEALALARAGTAGLPVPAFYGMAEHDGRRGPVMQRGAGIPLHAALARRPWTAPRLVDAMAALHARVHALSGDGLPGQSQRYRPGLDRASLPAEVDAAVRARLAEAAGADRLCHGDFHPANLLVAGRRLTLIDWDKAHAGVPALDVARTIVQVLYGKRGGNPLRPGETWLRRGLARAYRRRYAAHAEAGADAAVDHWLPVAIAAKLAFAPPAVRPAMHAELERLLSAAARR